MSESDDILSNWAQSLKRLEDQKQVEFRQGRKTAGVEPCPVCGAGLVNDQCLSCGYPKNLLTCGHCGSKYPNGETCEKCGWSKDTPLCRNCNADLIPGHMVRKKLEDDWMWKCCAYCGWPIERYLQRTAIYEPYLKPYEGHYSEGSGLFGNLMGMVILVFMVAAVFPVILDMGNHSGFLPTGNITSTSPNGTSVQGAIQAVSTTLGTGPIIQVFPLVFVVMFFLVVAGKIFRGNSI